MAHYTSFPAAPMITRGRAAGLLVLARTPATPAFRGADTQAAADLAARAGSVIAGSLALMRHRSVAEALQPPRPTVSQEGPGHLEIAGRCLPAAGCDAGGDWYNIVSLPRERTGLIVGDAMGHGPQAATVMARLSAAGYARPRLVHRRPGGNPHPLFRQGILALRPVLARQHRHLHAACEEIIASLGEHYEDDITLVLASIPRSATS
jgi:Stage II sporulation protein E (SpoIIE)